MMIEELDEETARRYAEAEGAEKSTLFEVIRFLYELEKYMVDRADFSSDGGPNREMVFAGKLSTYIRELEYLT